MTFDLQVPSRSLAMSGASGRIARLIAPFLPDARRLYRQDDWALLAQGTDALICLAGQTTGDTDGLAHNTQTALRALDAAARAGVPRVFLMSSAAVYGRADDILSASAAPTPAAPYGAAKAAMEEAVADWVAQHPDGPLVTCLRLGNVAGADALLGNLTDGIKPDLHVWLDGTSPRRSYIGPRTLARAFQTLAAQEVLPPILNLAAPGMVEMADLLRAAGHDWTKVPAPDHAISSVHLDTAPLEAIMSFPDDSRTAKGMVTEWREAQ